MTDLVVQLWESCIANELDARLGYSDLTDARKMMEESPANGAQAIFAAGIKHAAKTLGFDTDGNPHEKSYCVYAARLEGPDPVVKIGNSYKMKERLKALQAPLPRALRMLHILGFQSSEASRAGEQAVHAALSHCRLRGEWFDVSEEELDRVFRQLEDGTPSERKL